jgi:uncharacterized protein (DUF2461 family)
MITEGFADLDDALAWAKFNGVPSRVVNTLRSLRHLGLDPENDDHWTRTPVLAPKTQAEIIDDLKDGRYDLTTVIDAVILANGIIGVGLITLADRVATYIRNHKGAR